MIFKQWLQYGTFLPSIILLASAMNPSLFLNPSSCNLLFSSCSSLIFFPSSLSNISKENGMSLNQFYVLSFCFVSVCHSLRKNINNTKTTIIIQKSSLLAIVDTFNFSFILIWSITAVWKWKKDKYEKSLATSVY